MNLFSKLESGFEFEYYFLIFSGTTELLGSNRSMGCNYP